MFQIHALSPEPFAPLFAVPDSVLAAVGARRCVATANPGFPCRVSLADAEPGETVLLVHFEHQGADSPFRASHAIYVRQGVDRALPAPGVVPAMLRSRVLSLRAFDSAGMMTGAELADGAALEEAAGRMLADASAAYLHVHFAKPGCFACRIERS